MIFISKRKCYSLVEYDEVLTNISTRKGNTTLHYTHLSTIQFCNDFEAVCNKTHSIYCIQHRIASINIASTHRMMLRYSVMNELHLNMLCDKCCVPPLHSNKECADNGVPTTVYGSGLTTIICVAMQHSQTIPCM